MLAVREMLEGETHRPLLIGVTVLTSMSLTGLRQLGIERDLESHVDYLAGLAHGRRVRWGRLFGTRSWRDSVNQSIRIFV